MADCAFRGLFLVFVLSFTTGVCSGAPNDDLFVAAELAPADASLYVHVRNGAQLRKKIAGRPIIRWFDALLLSNQTGAAWRRIARDSGLDEAEIFDAMLGRDMILIARPETDAMDWVVVTEPDPTNSRELLQGLRPVQLAPQSGCTLFRLPDQEIELAIRDGRWIIAPHRRGRLFDELLQRPDQPSETTRTMASHAAVRRGRELGGGAFAVIMQHEKPLGGWSVVVGDLMGERGALRVASSFEHAPFQRPVTEFAINRTSLTAFEKNMLLAMIEPTDIGDGPWELFVEATIGERLISPEMKANIENQRIIAIGELEGRRENPDVDMLIPAGSLAIRVRNEGPARLQLDRQIVRVADALKRSTEGSLVIEVPSISSFSEDSPGRIDLQPVAEAFGPGFPVMSSVSLNWTTTTGPSGSYYVIATHPQQLEQTVEALQCVPSEPEVSGKWQGCGTINGQRLGVHLRSWRAEAAMLLGARTLEEIADLESTIDLFAALAEGLDRCRWALKRPAENEMFLEVDFTLAPRESAEAPH